VKLYSSMQYEFYTGIGDVWLPVPSESVDQDCQVSGWSASLLFLSSLHCSDITVSATGKKTAPLIHKAFSLGSPY